ncbi:MAG TPA: ATP-binding cassette domain-containing protein [Anaerolineales bacterium]|nr:ATP-binding cassette domain-containing protein [Anaerolineales bacterium]
MDKERIVLCDNLVKIYKVADLEVVALQGLDLEVRAGETIALIGPSGAGKSTLLNLLGGLDVPSAGRLVVAGRDLLKMGEADRVEYKRDMVGFVWQQPSRNLLPYLTARENVELPMLLAGVGTAARKKRALELLDRVMLSDRANFRPERLSGGQQQRVALAIALANHPALLLGDELTGQIDTESADEVFAALRRINRDMGTTIVIVTHDPKIAARVDRVIAIRDGRTSTEVRRTFDREGMISEEEWVIMDAAGRLQIPRPYLDELSLKDRVKVKLESDHVSVWAEAPEAVRGPGGSTDGVFWKPPSMRAFLRSAGTDPYGDGGEAERPQDEVQPAMTGQGVAIRCEDVDRTFYLGVEEIRAVDGVSFEIPPGALAVLKGRSGSGKTTLLNLIAGLDEPTGGKVYFGEEDLATLSTGQRIRLRRERIGFVYQTFGLLPYLSAGENVEVPLRMVRTPGRVRRERVREVLGLVGLSERIDHRTFELSGGEQQRVAIARALVNRPGLLLADEPTGQLDTATGAIIIALLKRVAADSGVTVLVASHDVNVHGAADVVFELQDGRLVEDYV